MTSPQHDREQLTDQIRRAVKPFAADYAHDIADAILPVQDAAVAAAVRRALEEAADALRMDWGGTDQDEGIDAAREQLRARAAAVASPDRVQGACPRCKGTGIDPENVSEEYTPLGTRELPEPCAACQFPASESGGTE